MSKEVFKSGFVSIVGRPNVGKSTLLNEVIGQKIAIMSDKAQTTRNKVQGVYSRDDAQVVFIDTPGIHKPKHKLGDFMIKMAQSSLNEVDLILFVINAEEGYGAGDQYIIDRLQNVESPVFLVINKIDQVHPEQLFPMINFYKDKYSFAEIVPISALQGNNVNTLLEQVVDYLEEGPQYYPSDHVTDHPERFIVAELVREKVLHLTREEIPHSVTVVTEQMVKREGSDVIDIHVTVVVERSSQKGIIIGKQGKMLKEVGKRARQDIEALLGSRVFMEIWVKVVKDWRNKPSSLRDYGYREDDY